jgi:excisionase family DNA binding protein
MTESEQLFKINDVAALTKLTSRTIRNHLHGDNPIPHFRIGRALRFRLSEVEGWLQRQRQKDTKAKTDIADTIIAELLGKSQKTDAPQKGASNLKGKVAK